MASRSRTRRIGFLGYPQLTALDLVGPAEVFATAAALLQADRPSSRPVYEVIVLGLDAGAFRAESGLVFLPDVALADAPALDTLIVPGGRGLREPASLALVAKWLRRQQRGFRRVASVCTGAWALAEAGLLDGLRATTHWRHADVLARSYPKIRVEADTLYIREDRIYTSAGITAGIDLALALVEEDHGPSLALAVARELVVHLKRAGGQRQYSERLAMTVDAGSQLEELTAWMHDHLADDLSLSRLAERCHISPRQLARRFAATVGLSPAVYVERLRIDEASQLLLAGGSIERVAAAVGFRSADVFRRAFERRLGVSPQQFRARFGT
jgi:transcriptional regulator GlxA family with amidase domain